MLNKYFSLIITTALMFTVPSPTNAAAALVKACCNKKWAAVPTPTPTPMPTPESSPRRPSPIRPTSMSPIKPLPQPVIPVHERDPRYFDEDTTALDMDQLMTRHYQLRAFKRDLRERGLDSSEGELEATHASDLVESRLPRVLGGYAANVNERLAANPDATLRDVYPNVYAIGTALSSPFNRHRQFNPLIQAVNEIAETGRLTPLPVPAGTPSIQAPVTGISILSRSFVARGSDDDEKTSI